LQNADLKFRVIHPYGTITLKKEKLYRTSLIVLTLLQIGLSALYLNSLSRIENWSAVFAEDSRGYLLVADYFQGREIPADELPLLRYRLFSPLMPLVASLLGTLTGIPAAFLIINILLWLITALLFYEFLKIVLEDAFFAFAGAAIFTTSLPMIEWALPVMVDMGSYFFACLILLLYLRLFHSGPSLTPRGSFLQGRDIRGEVCLGLCLALAMLTKPMLLILLLFVLSAFAYEKRYASIPVTCVLPLALVMAIYSLFNLSFSDFSAFGGPRHRGPVYLFTAALFCYHGGWIFLRSGWKSAPGYRHLYLIYILAFAVPYLVFVHNPRLFFLSYPVIIALVAQGIKETCRQRGNAFRAGAALLGAYILTSNALAVLHLYIMRCLKIRDWEGLMRLFQ
jgi:4-amino-4-deoxy-L-arabinose transferase-like glycosyltransferase